MNKKEIIQSMDAGQKNKFRELYAEANSAYGYGMLDDFAHKVMLILVECGVKLESLKDSTANAVVDKLTF